MPLFLKKIVIVKKKHYLCKMNYKIDKYSQQVTYNPTQSTTYLIDYDVVEDTGSDTKVVGGEYITTTYKNKELYVNDITILTNGNIVKKINIEKLKKTENRKRAFLIERLFSQLFSKELD